VTGRLSSAVPAGQGGRATSGKVQAMDNLRGCVLMVLS